MENFCKIKSKKVALDIEGTIADIHGLFVKHHNSKYGGNFSIEDITNWNVEDTKLNE